MQGLQFRPVPPGTGGTYRCADRPLPGSSAKNRSSAVDFSRRRPIEEEIDRRWSIEEEKGKKKREKKEEKKEYLVGMPSSPTCRRRPRVAYAPRPLFLSREALSSPTYRCRPWVSCAPSPSTGCLRAVAGRFFSRARRRSVSLRGEKDRGDIALLFFFFKYFNIILYYIIIPGGMHCTYRLVPILYQYRQYVGTLVRTEASVKSCVLMFYPIILQDPTTAWSQQADPNQWAGAYYGYGYDAYAYGAAQDPSFGKARTARYVPVRQLTGMRTGCYRAVLFLPQVESVPEMTHMVGGAVPSMEQREENYDPLAIPDVDK
ncbi:hypothetical protein GW17_00030434 [Ensete ventricosum]|nr:hypothetical protein GW17_00030434 [Ensete ventricosum]